MVENLFLPDLRPANKRKLLEASIENVQINWLCKNLCQHSYLIFGSKLVGGEYKIHLIWKVENTEICDLTFVTIVHNQITNKTCTEVAS